MADDNKKPSNGRLHEPDLREIVAELDGFRDLMNERDRRYESRFLAQDEKTSLALTASKEAVTKAEIATEKRFDSVNEFRQTLSDQSNTFMPRSESGTITTAQNEKIEDARKQLAQFQQYRIGHEERTKGVNLVWGALAVVASLLIGLGVGIVNLIAKK